MVQFVYRQDSSREKELVVYSGDCFTIEWYFSEDGKSDALKYYSKLSVKQRRKFLILVKRMGDIGRIFDKTKFRSEGNQIYAFKPQPDRFLCFFVKNKKIIITNGFSKRQQQLPDREKKRALSFKKSYEKRVGIGKYYD